MPEQVPPVSTGPSRDKPLEFQSESPPPTDWSARGSPSIRTRAGLLTAALILIALAGTFVAGVAWFRADGDRKGYAAGFGSIGYFEAVAIADSMEAVACDTVLARAGLMPDSGRQGLWQVARFSLTPAKALCRYGTGRALDTMKLPVFSEHEQAPAGRSYRSGGGRIYHVDR